MAMAKKGSRLIEVGGTGFRWKVRRRPTYCQAMGWTPLTFVVERAEEPRSRLVVTLPRAHPGNWLEPPTAAVTPSMVIAAVAEGIERGWRPCEGGPGSLLELGESAVRG
ncbi:hypothetical protein EDD29_5858 [Actinocorallia herbida]|uniref:Uncharacterized protein n=1 Tax=Actinocorallia herbida TaxID=58109 RepID=A0A3N1D3Y4_9ACTN|nr:hypothetical protein [Actinocorallia herbida]ROO88196.1 hypothetical protein EDD29_5858 [Actinocorallia herbida]